MKAMILAGGRGERLGDICQGTPKVMLPINGRPILEHNLRYLKKSGIRDITLNLHYRAAVIRDFLREKKNFGLRLRFSNEPELLGTAGAIKKVEAQFQKSPFLVLYGDNLMDFDVTQLLQAHQKHGPIMTLGVYHPRETRWSGVAAGLIEVFSDGRIKKFLERTSNRTVPGRYWVNAGIMIVSPRIFRYIPEKQFCDFGKDVFPKLLRKKIRLQTASGASYVLASDTVKSWQATLRLAKKLIGEAKHERH